MKNTGRGTRLFRALLRLLPFEFRGDFGDQMAADFDERRREPHAQVWTRELSSLLATAIREHAAILRADVHYALRLMRRTPGFTAMAVLMIALGTGVNVAVFTIVDGVMLRSPFTDPGRLVSIQIPSDTGWTSRVPLTTFAALAAAPGPLAAVAARGQGEHILTGSGETRRVDDIECVTPGFFDVMGTRPWLGRTFDAADDAPAATPTIVLNHRFWRELGGSPDIVGTTLAINQTPVTVIGVTPRGFDGSYSRMDVQGWLPLNRPLDAPGVTGCRARGGASVYGRVRPEYTLREARLRLPGYQLASVQERTFGDLRPRFFALAGAVVCVLLIACLNVGGLQMERTLARRREMAVRLALGATRVRIVRQTLTENLVLSLAGSLAGVMAAWVALGAIVSLMPGNMPHVDEIELNARVLLAALVAAGATGLVAGIIPSGQVRRCEPARDLAAASRATNRGGWPRHALVAIEVALSIVVLIGAALMIQTFWTLRPTAPGFDPARKLITSVRLVGVSRPDSEPFYDRLFDDIRALPGVRGVAGASHLPMSGVVSEVTATVRDRKITAFAPRVTPGYLTLMQIPLVAGRGFDAGDTSQAPPVVIVNEIFARRLRPDGAVVGEAILVDHPYRPREPPVERRIVGVAANTRSSGGDTRVRPELFLPYRQTPAATPANLNVVVETDGRSDAAIALGIRAAIRAARPGMVVEPVTPLTTMLSRRVASPRLGAWLLGVFAALAVTLAAVGLLATTGWWVTARTREIGVRIALGATSTQVMRLVVVQGLIVVASGIGAGCLAAAGLTRYLEGWIYGITPLDPRTFAACATLMFAVAACAVYVPVRRATRVDPVVALRAD